ncbi:hypothetical protein LCGC14_0809630 [marine sediment metagenome]|uniref:Uncharacterized protein n=1 Tax=marine sediment metagenome TaxID=412755 RepID=A0A0F9PM54_9ZZZZ
MPYVSPPGGRGSIIGATWIPSEERGSYVEVECARCYSVVYMGKLQVIMKEGVEKSRGVWPEYLSEGWDVICQDCADERNQKWLRERKDQRRAQQ